jgi:hypothetical protein
MGLTFYLLGAIGSFALGVMIGRYTGYRDAQPIRDKRGRFISRSE